jgi:hypothetical protein
MGSQQLRKHMVDPKTDGQNNEQRVSFKKERSNHGKDQDRLQEGLL